MARGDALIFQSVTDGLAQGSYVTYRPASGTEVCMTSVNMPGAGVMYLGTGPSTAGTSNQPILLGGPQQGIKIFCDNGDYFRFYYSGSSNYRWDVHVSGIITKA